MKSTTIALLTLFMGSCTQNKPVTTDVDQADKEITIEQMDDSLIIGVVKKSEEGSQCQYTIKTKEVSYLMDPINLAEEFKVDGLRVKFKYRGLRRQARCPETQPVEVERMVKA